MAIVTDENDPRLKRGPDNTEVPQNEAYLVMSDEELAKGFVRPVRASYTHVLCGTTTTMNRKIAETYAAQPSFYGYTYCVHCRKHLPVADFNWYGTDLKVGS